MQFEVKQVATVVRSFVVDADSEDDARQALDTLLEAGQQPIEEDEYTIEVEVRPLED